jgi:ABC-2 type transport system permease protein
MRAILTMTFNDLRIFLSQAGNWVGLLLLPILFTVGLGFAFGGDSGGPEMLRVDVLDHDQSAASRQLLDELAAANDTLFFCRLDGSQPDTDMDGDGEDGCGIENAPLNLEEAQARVAEGGSSALIVIPAGYGEALETLEEVQIDFYSTTAPTTPDPVLQALNAVLLRVNSAAVTAGVADAVLVRVGEQTGLTRVIDPWRVAFARTVYSATETLLEERPDAVRYELVGGESPLNEDGGFSQSVPGVGAMFVMFTVFGGMVLIQRERQRGTLQRLGVFPLTRGQILAGKILTYFILGMVQYLIVFTVGLLAGLNFGPNPSLVFLVIMAFVLCCTALTFAVAPSLHSEGQANVVTQFFSLTFASLGGAWWPLEIVPRAMQIIGHLTPVAWVMDAFRDLLYYGGGFAEIMPEVGVLLGAAVLLFGVGIWRFRYL